MYSDGKSIRQISKDCGFSYGFIRRLMIIYDIERRDRIAASIIATDNPQYREKLSRIRLARLGRRNGSHDDVLRTIRMSIRPLLSSIKMNARCTCGRTASVVHHEKELAIWLDELLELGQSLLQATISIIRAHYAGEVDLLPACEDCHSRLHYQK